MDDDTCLSLVLPWPPSALSANARHGHWGARARAARAYREACGWQAIAQGARRMAADARLHVHLRFVPPDRRRRDDQNLIAAMKSGLDGLADVLEVDDSRWHVTHDPLDREGGAIGGFVRVTVSRRDGIP